MNLKDFKFIMPNTWEEISRTGSEDQVNVRVYHRNPLSSLDPKRFQDQVTYRGEVSVNQLSVQVPGRAARPGEDFYKIMKGAIEGGIMPAGVMTMGKLDELWKGLTKTPHGERPGESDMTGDIDITRYKDEETAWQTLKNKGLMQTEGFDVPIPGGISIPGMPKNMTMSELFQSDMLKKFIPKEHLDKLGKMQLAMKEAGKQMPKIKEDRKKKGVKYVEGKYLGCKTVYLVTPNQTPPPEQKTKTSSPNANPSGFGMGGKGIDAFEKRQGHIADLDPLPKMEEPYAATNNMYLGLLFKNFVINGPLLWGIEHLPSGKTPCYSLTRTKEVTSTDTVEGKKFTGITIVPLPSTFAKEGYLYREEVEEIYRGIVERLDKVRK